MSDLITAPGQTTTLTNAGTFTAATISSFSTLLTEGADADITVLGTTTVDPGGGLTADNGGELRLLGPFSGTVMLTGTASVVELGIGTATVNLIDGTGSNPHETNGTIIVDGTAEDVSVLGFYTGDTLQFSSPASSFVYTDNTNGGGLGLEIDGTLGVTETNGDVANIILEGFFSDSYSFNPPYAQGNFSIENGTVIYQPIVPPAPPTIAGSLSGQQVNQGEPIDLFAHVTISDQNANQVETVMVQLSQVTGTLSDPNSEIDASSYNAQTGAYSVSGSPDSVSQDLQGLVFTPNIYTLGMNETVTTQFQINVTDTAGATASDDNTSVVVFACYAAGTRLATPDGPVAVEALRPGARLLTAKGAVMVVRWLGHRRVDCTRHPHPAQVHPVRIMRHAFADGMPCRDLWLSPDHAVFVDDVLIPVINLVNGRSIAQIPVESIEYWHVELERHDVLLAEGLPAESYLDTGNRAAFANGGPHIELHPDFCARTWEDACAELVVDGPLLLAIRQRLFARAGIRSGRPAPLLLALVDQQKLVPTMAAPGVWRFAIPPATRTLHLVSPPWVPAAHDAASRDRRVLGVRLFGVAFDGPGIALDNPALFSGFHATEQTAEGACRWTTGDARLVLPVDARNVTLHLDDGVASWTGPLATAVAVI